MAYSELLYTGDGVTTDYSVTFDYLDQSHVFVAVDKILTTSPGSNYKFEFINSNTVRVRTIVDEDPVPAGLEVRVFRVTPIDTPAVIFGGGASLTSNNLNKNSEYLTFALQEATDENDAFTRRYLGAFASAPAVDNSGDPLLVGASYFNTVEESLEFWNGSEWKKGDLLEASIAARDIAVTASSSASTSATNAATSETNAATSASEASASAAGVAASASAASTSEANAAASETAAGTSESNAAASESAAATSESNAATSESNAASSASAAATSETNAASSASAAVSSFDSFDDRYLGAKASEPTTDNDGDPLVVGAVFFDSTAGELKVWDGSSWQTGLVPATGYVTQTSSTGSAELPAGTTAERDGTPSAGYIRFNSTDSTFEGYDGTAWGSIGGGTDLTAVDSNILPDTDATYNVGSTSLKWSTGYFDNISDGTTTVGTEYVVNGSAKSWVNFNGTGTIAIRDSFNVSSLTDNGTGDYTISFSNTMAGNNFAVSSSLQIPTVIAGVRVPTIVTTGWRLICTTDAAAADPDPVTSGVHGDLA